MTKGLSVKGKTGYIGGTVVKPTNPSDLPHWIRCDDLVGSWISNSVDPEIRSSTMNFPSAREQWLEIKSRFSHHNASELYALKQSIATLKQDHLSVAMYYTHLKSLWDQLDAFRPIKPCICGAEKNYVNNHNQDRSMELLQGLHDRFSSMRSQILLMEPMPSPAKIYYHVRKEEEQQGITSSSTTSVESATFNISRSDHRNPRAFPNNGNNKRQRPFCDHCNKYGHTKTTCWKLNGYPKDLPNPKDSESFHVAAMDAPAASAAPNISASQYA
ncbi:uncharacterized protein LOC113353239 [Papaver somniferum]|uniref:uncharacterized protein LOC113353239 n=1 Tax=Papaver somniferum TaxID=3469 RepID=UPI000E701EB9|nr:uncharacterized protein LOC113353239 [Papaver somniferum]